MFNGIPILSCIGDGTLEHVGPPGGGNWWPRWSRWVTRCPERFGAHIQGAAGCLEVVLVAQLWGP